VNPDRHQESHAAGHEPSYAREKSRTKQFFGDAAVVDKFEHEPLRFRKPDSA
jgi:hypothetical protein